MIPLFAESKENSRLLGGCLSLRKMLVLENVVLTEAVVPCTAGTVPEFQLWVAGIRPTADGTLVAIAPFSILLFLLANGGLKLYGLLGVLMPETETKFRQQIPDAIPEENKIGEPDTKIHGQHKNQVSKSVFENIINSEYDIQRCQPLGLNGDDELDADHGGRKQSGEYQKENIIQHTVGDVGIIRPQQADKSENNGYNDTREVK